MRTNRIIAKLITSILCWLLCASPIAYSQEKKSEAASDSTKIVQSTVIQSADSLTNKKQHDLKSVATPTETELIQTDGAGEMTLNTIEIEAVIETPSVNIVPKRINPEMGKVEFVDRSFENELKAIPIQPVLAGKEMSEVSKIKKLKTDKRKDKNSSAEKKAE